MTDLVLTVVATVIVAGAGFGLAVFVLDRTPGLSDPIPDGKPRRLPTDGPITGEDVHKVTFDMALRGYRMSQVDAVLRQLGDELSAARARIAVLERDQTSSTQLPVANEDPFASGNDRDEQADETGQVSNGSASEK